VEESDGGRGSLETQTNMELSKPALATKISGNYTTRREDIILSCVLSGNPSLQSRSRFGFLLSVSIFYLLLNQSLPNSPTQPAQSNPPPTIKQPVPGYLNLSLRDNTDVERKLESRITENPTPEPREKRIKGTPSMRTQEIGWQKESGRARKNSLDHSEFSGHIRAYIQTA